MLLIKLLLQIIYIENILSLDITPESPVPHAELLDKILEDSGIRNYTERYSVIDYIFGDNNTDLEKLQASEYLDISVLSPENVKKIVDEARRKYILEINSNNSYNESLTDNLGSFDNKSSTDSLRRHWVYHENPFYIRKAFNWMRQSIYSTRRRLEVTRPYRKKYHMNISYNIGILYGMLSETMIKAENLYAALKKIEHHFHFVFFLFGYQRILHMHVDIKYLTLRMFEFQKKWNKMLGKAQPGESGEQGGLQIDNLDPAMLPEEINTDILDAIGHAGEIPSGQEGIGKEIPISMPIAPPSQSKFDGPSGIPGPYGGQGPPEAPWPPGGLPPNYS